MAAVPVPIPDGYGPPVVIGGAAGSGTRVGAALLDELGFYIGFDTNKALDNLAYTFLLKRPRWYERRSTRQRRFDAGARPFVRSMTTGGRPPARELVTLAGAWYSTTRRGHDRLGRRRRRWATRMVRLIVNSEGHDPSRHAGWAWKEPATLMLLPELVEAFPQMRFIHIVRDPERLARRQTQTIEMVLNWSQNFGLRPPQEGEDSYAATLEFLRLVTERAERVGRARLGERYHQLDIDLLCEQPEPQLDALLAFLGVEVDPETRERLLAIPDPGRLAAPGPAPRP